MLCTGDMWTSRRVHQNLKLGTRRQQIPAKARSADRGIAARVRQLQADEARAERKLETRRKSVFGAIVRGAPMSEPRSASAGWWRSSTP